MKNYPACKELKHDPLEPKENTFNLLSHMIWAMACDFQQCGILTSVDSDEPVQPPLSLETPNNVQSVA